MKLFGTPISHFTRKVRLLLDHLQYPYAMIDVGNVAEQEQATFGGNPLMNVPVWEDAAGTVYGSDHIAAYLVRQIALEDSYNVLASDTETLNARNLLNGAMSAEVRLVLADRTGVETVNVLFFDKARHAISNVLDWCEARPDLFGDSPSSYLAFHFISFWDHLHFYQLVDGNWPTLKRLADQISASDIVSQSSPFQSQ